MTPQVLAKTQELLRERGWGQGQGTAPNGAHCLVAALHLAVCKLTGSHDVEVYNDATTYLREKLKITKDNYRSLARWNDERGRTVEEVMEALNYG